MLKNYIKIAWRNLKKDKTFAFLNIVGLSVAFGVAILLSMAAFFELSYDKFHTNGDNIYKVYNEIQTPRGPEAGTSQPAPFANALTKEVPGISKVTRYLQDGALVMYKDKEINMSTVWVDADFFTMFSFSKFAGNSNNPLKELSNIVLSKKMATALFGDENAIDKTINILINGKGTPFTVASVVENTKSNSTLEFCLAIRFENHQSYTKNKEEWDSQYHDVYVQLQNEVNAKQFEDQTNSFVDLHYKESIENLKRDGAQPDANGRYFTINLLPLKDVHYTNFQNGYAKISRTIPYLVLSVAFLILFIACVNFINMSIAKSTQRLREIGMRKTLGAQKKQLFFQFWSESLMLFSVSLFIGIGLSILFLKDFQEIFRTNVTFSMFTNPLNIILFIVVIVLVTLLVGGYPAMLMSKLSTIQSLKGKVETNGKNVVRNVLMVVQFSIAILLISGTLVLWSQLEFMRNKNLGFDKSQVVAFPIDGKMDSRRAVNLLRDQLKVNPNIISVTASDNILGLGKDGSQFSSRLGFEYKGRVVKTNMLVVDYDYIETLGLELIQGRSFDRQYPGDALGMVINESMARELDEEDPLNATIMMSDSTKYQVLGIVKDYHFESLTKSIEPLTFFMNTDWDLYYAYVKVAPENLSKSYDAIEQTWKTLEPNAKFLGSFLNDNIDRTFRSEKIMATMITSGSIIAIVLSCIGLFAISLLVVAQRTKEIGVRKVVGASISSITYLLTKDFLKLVAIAFVIAAPVAWWLMNQWLQDYVYRIDLSIWIFALAGLLTVLIALFTVGVKTLKAAMQNPVKSLKTE